jgi:N6-adenosine-specific RNA methylase IME4
VTQLALPGRDLGLGWEFPADLPEADWLAAGQVLGKVEQGVSWWVGDWWAFGERHYGQRKAVVTAPGWQGPAYQTCRNAAVVANRFELYRRRYNLSFHHHAEVASLKGSEADALLDWAQEPIAQTGRARTTRELRAEVFRRRVASRKQLDGGCTVSDLDELIASGARFPVILAGPPWMYGGGAAERHYETQTIDEIKAMPVEQLAADDCALFLWCVMPLLPEALQVIEAWGFTFKTAAFNWVKQNPSGAGLFMGRGNWTRSNAELCLLATRGSPRRQATDVDQVIMSPVAEHSRKPDEAQDRIERLIDGPYLELYARRPRSRWTVWGNEIPRDLFQMERAA